MTSYVTGLQCRECGRPYPKAPLSVCEYCFGPLEVNYDYAGAKNALSRASIVRIVAMTYSGRSVKSRQVKCRTVQPVATSLFGKPG